jgi:hypothetical protein
MIVKLWVLSSFVFVFFLCVKFCRFCIHLLTEILNPADGPSAMHAPQLVQSEWCAISTIMEGCTIFASGKKEKRNCNHSCHLSYSDLWPYFCGEGSENLIIVKPECSLRCVSSCGRNPEILHSPFLRRNLNPADQEKCGCKGPQEGSVIITLTRWIGKSDELQACPSALLCLLLVRKSLDSPFLMRNLNPVDHLRCTHHSLSTTPGTRLSWRLKKMLICLWQQGTLSDCNHSEISFHLLTRICDHTVHHCTAWSKTDRRHGFSLLLVQGS